MNSLLLDYEIRKRGKTLKEVSSSLGMDESTFYRKKTGKTDFTRNEIKMIKELLKLGNDQIDAIFFADELA